MANQPYDILSGMDPTIKSEGAYWDEARGNAAMEEMANNPMGITKRVVQAPGMDPMTVMETPERLNPYYNKKRENIEMKVVKDMPKGGYEMSEYNVKLGEKIREWAQENGVDINSPEGSEWYTRALKEGQDEGVKAGYVRPPASKNDFIETNHGMFDVRTREYVRPVQPGSQPGSQPSGNVPPQGDISIIPPPSGASDIVSGGLMDFYRNKIRENEIIRQNYPGTAAAENASKDNMKILENVRKIQDKEEAQKISRERMEMDKKEEARRVEKQSFERGALKPEQAKELASIAANANAYDDIIKAYDDLSAKGMAGPVSGRKEGLKNMVGMGEKDFTREKVRLKAKLVQFARSLQGAGVLSNQDIDFAADLSPTLDVGRDQFIGATQGQAAYLLDQVKSSRETRSGVLTPENLKMYDKVIAILEKASGGAANPVKPKSTPQAQSKTEGKPRKDSLGILK